MSTIRSQFLRRRAVAWAAGGGMGGGICTHLLTSAPVSSHLLGAQCLSASSFRASKAPHFEHFRAADPTARLKALSRPSMRIKGQRLAQGAAPGAAGPAPAAPAAPAAAAAPPGPGVVRLPGFAAWLKDGKPKLLKAFDHHSGRAIAAYKTAAGAHLAIMAAADPVSSCLPSSLSRFPPSSPDALPSQLLLNLRSLLLDLPYRRCSTTRCTRTEFHCLR